MHIRFGDGGITEASALMASGRAIIGMETSSKPGIADEQEPDVFNHPIHAMVLVQGDPFPIPDR